MLLPVDISSVQSLSLVQLFVTPWTAPTRLPCPSLTPRAYSNSCPSSWWCHPPISSCIVPFSSCHQSFQASGSFPMSQFFESGGQSNGTSVSAWEFLWIFRIYFIQDGLVGSPCSPRDSQESFPTPQFKCINSSALSPLYSSALSPLYCPTLISIHDYQINHSFD